MPSLTCGLYKLAVLGFEFPSTGPGAQSQWIQINEFESKSSFCFSTITAAEDRHILGNERLGRIRMIVLEGSLETAHFTDEETSVAFEASVFFSSTGFIGFHS